MSENEKSEQNKENLEHKVKLSERAKYAAIPGAATIASMFTPEIKNNYNSLEVEKRETYLRIVKTAAGSIVGGVLAYILSKNEKNDKESEKYER